MYQTACTIIVEIDGALKERLHRPDQDRALKGLTKKLFFSDYHPLRGDIQILI
jgi:hypothetical protein